jgi:NADH dehydrogenase
VIWTGGTEPHPLLKELAIAPEHRDPRGRLQVSSTLQLPDFPEVFAAGDCAYVKEDPQPPTAQVAYQQGKAIAENLRAIAQGKQPQPAPVAMRGTLMKLGVGEGVANLFNRLTLTGELGHLIRQAAYIELLPTPGRNFRATTEWFTDALFQRHQPQALAATSAGRTPLLAGISAVLVGFLISGPLIWRAAQPQQFERASAWSGVPALLNRLAPPQPPQ